MQQIIYSLFFLILMSCTHNPSQSIGEGQNKAQSYIACEIPSEEFIFSSIRAIIANGSTTTKNLFSSGISKKPEILTTNFTNKNHKDYLVTCKPEFSAPSAHNVVLLLKVNCQGAKKWFIDWHATESVVKKDTIDINNDGIQELWLEGGLTWQGVTTQSYQLLSFKGDSTRVLYTCQGSVGLSPFVTKAQLNDTLSTSCRVTFKDVDKDGVKEIQEHIEYGLYNGGSNYEEITKRIRHVRTKNIWYFINGKFVRK